ncbi:MAG: MotA/TolQ/ExbB proton channel family protein [Phycisphaerales bacterium]
MLPQGVLVVLAVANPPAGAVPDHLRVGSVWDLLVKGGPVMIPIILCSLIAVAIVAERLIALRRSRLIPPPFVPGLKQVLRDPSRDRAAAISYCESDPSPIAAVFAVGIKRLGEPLDLLERHVSEAGERQVQRLRVRLRLLSVLATLAPLLGLLGTITGMISAFQTVAISGEALGKTEMLAKGIYEAMITTAAGLIVAIPLTLCYHWISSIIENRVAEIDGLVSEFVEHYALNGGRPPQIAAPQAELKPAGAPEAREPADALEPAGAPA